MYRVRNFLLAIVLSVSPVAAVAQDEGILEQAMATIGEFTLDQLISNEMISNFLDTQFGASSRSVDIAGVQFYGQVRDLTGEARDILYQEANHGGDYWYQYHKIQQSVYAVLVNYTNSPQMANALYERTFPEVVSWIGSENEACQIQQTLMFVEGKTWICADLQAQISSAAARYLVMLNMFHEDEGARAAMEAYLASERPLQVAYAAELNQRAGEDSFQLPLTDLVYITSLPTSAKNGWHNGYTQAEAEYWQSREALEAYFDSDYETISFIWRRYEMLTDEGFQVWIDLLGRFQDDLKSAFN